MRAKFYASAIVSLSLFGTTVACSSDTPATPDSGTDAQVTTDAAADADAAAPACDLDAPFGKATLVDYRPTADAGAVPLSGFLRIAAAKDNAAVFDAIQGQDTKIFAANHVGGTFTGAQERAASPTVVHAYPALSPDAKTMYFSAIVGGKNAIHRIDADRPDFAGATVWLGDPQANLVLPYAPNETSVYFIQGGTPMRVSVDGTGKAGTPAAVAGVPLNVNSVAVNGSETILYYGEGNSYDTAIMHEMKKSGDTWIAKDAQPIAIAGLEKIESPSWLSPDGCSIYVRGWANVVDRALFVATKPKK